MYLRNHLNHDINYLHQSKIFPCACLLSISDLFTPNPFSGHLDMDDYLQNLRTTLRVLSPAKHVQTTAVSLRCVSLTTLSGLPTIMKLVELCSKHLFIHLAPQQHYKHLNIGLHFISP